MINIGLWIAYILIILCVLSVIVLPIRAILQDPKSAKNAGIGLGVLLALFLISFMLSGGQVNEKFDISAGQSKLIGAGLTMLYLLGIGTLGLTIYSEFFSLFKKRS
jgi:hypothetical protein